MLKSDKIDITVLFATYNRAEGLRKTLEEMCAVDRGGLSVEFVVVDNNSDDDTPAVVESFADKLPVRYLYEPRPGKNCALNKAVREVELGKLIVFSDDDVNPDRDWLKKISEVSSRWCDHKVFGGRIEVVWPDGEIHDWAKSSYVRRFIFVEHRYAAEEKQYKHGEHPFGPNFWVRREVFDNGRLYDETIGPTPGNYIMGSESSFLIGLIRNGYDIVYSPDVVVGHRVRREQISAQYIRKRIYRLGRSIPHSRSLVQKELFEKSPLRWRVRRLLALIRFVLLLLRAKVYISSERRLEGTLYATQWLAFNIESLKIASKLNSNRQ